MLTIADLNEVVYAFDSVLGFTAGLDRGTTGDRLTLRVDARGDSPGDLFAAVARNVAVDTLCRPLGNRGRGGGVTGW